VRSSFVPARGVAGGQSLQLTLETANTRALNYVYPQLSTLAEFALIRRLGSETRYPLPPRDLPAGTVPMVLLRADLPIALGR
jgi:hypothetical protein